MKKEMKKFNDFQWSLMFTTASYPVFWEFLLIGSIFPLPIFTGFIWLPVIWQLVSCFLAIRFLKRNPNQKKKGVLCLIFAILVLVFIGYLSLAFTGLVNKDFSRFG